MNKPKKGFTAVTYVDKHQTQPHAKDLEEAVLGVLMMDKTASYIAMPILNPDCFYTSTYRLIFLAIQDLWNERSVCDILSVTHKLREMGTLEEVGGAYAVTQLTNRVASAATLEKNCYILLQMCLLRFIMQSGINMNMKAAADKADAVILMDEWNNVYKEMCSMVNATRSNSSDIAINIAKQFEQGTYVTTFLTTGFAEIDKYIIGRQYGCMDVIGGRPGMGKTAYALSEAIQLCTINKVKVGFASLEMKSQRLLFRIIAHEVGISHSEINRRSKKDAKDPLTDLERAKIAKALRNIPSDFIIVDDLHTLESLVSWILFMFHVHNMRNFYIDYLQLIRVTSMQFRNREEEVAHISRTLKHLTNQLWINIVPLCQLSRLTESRKDPRPTLSDLRESGAIEQDADSVMFPYRPAYYGIKKDAAKMPIPPEYTEMILAKNRDGGTDINPVLNFIGKFTRFVNRPEDVPVGEKEIYVTYEENEDGPF